MYLTKHIYICISLLISSGFIFAQNDLSKPEDFFLTKALSKDTLSTVNMSLSGGYSLNSNTITSQSMSDFINANTIDEYDKSNMLSSVKENNIFGYGADGGLTLKYKKSKKINVVIGLYYKEIAGFKFNKNLINLALNGNQMFAGQNINLGPCKLTYLTYQQLYVGVEKKIEKSTFGVGLSILNGTKLKYLNVSRAQLFTESEGLYIDFDTEFDTKKSINGKLNNGLGMSLSLNYKYISDKNNFIFNVSDIGFINWEGLSNYGINKKYHFEGIAITDIFNFNESAFSGLNISNFKSTLGINPSIKSELIATPATISADYLRSLGKLGLGAGAKQLVFISYNPKIYGRVSYDLSDNWWSAATVSYGGFGGFDYELAIGGQIINKLHIGINMHYAEWLITPSTTSGQGINLVLSKNL